VRGGGGAGGGALKHESVPNEGLRTTTAPDRWNECMFLCGVWVSEMKVCKEVDGVYSWGRVTVCDGVCPGGGGRG
jgi:hypothetical protein